MIPKIIHYTWFSNDPYPEMVEECIASWHKQMPEYEFRLWDMSSIIDIDSVFLREALKERKWAFAADVVRLYAVYHYGGIYLDTDVMVYSSFDSLLSHQAFIGRENSVHIEGRKTESFLTSHCFGAVKHHPFIGRCLHYYDNRHFVTSLDETLPMPLRYDSKLLPFIQSELAREIGYNSSLQNEDGIQECDDGLIVLPKYYLDWDFVLNPQYRYCRHFALGAWREREKTEDKLTLGFRIRFKIESLIRKVLEKFGYLMYKKR